MESPSPGELFNSLSRVTALSSTDAWAVGMQISAPGDLFTINTLAEHWDGSAWSEVPTPTSFEGWLSGIHALAANDIWAVGSVFEDPIESSPIVEHWDGAAWNVVPSPDIELANLFDVAGTSSSDLWAVGTYRGRFPAMLIEHYDGTRWSRVSVPPISSDFIALSAVTAVSPTNVWSVGYYLGSDGRNKPLAVHYDGSSWRLVTVPSKGLGDEELNDVVATNSGHVWVAGRGSDGAHFRTLALHWTGHRFRIVRTPNLGMGDNGLSGMAARSRGRMRAVGSWTDQTGMARTLVLDYARGKWLRVSSPNASEEENSLASVAISPQGDSWAVGGRDPHSVGKTLIEHVCG
ncbi:MAG TPA: hypothetical protein VGL18_07175 [Actinomycetota bacterium]